MTASVPPGWAFTADDVRQLGHRTVEIIVAYLSGLRERPVFQPYPTDLAGALGAERAPDHGATVDAVLDDFLQRVAPYPFGNGHPRFFGWVNSPPHLLGIVADALAATMNPSVAGGNHAAVHIERQVVRWFADLAGFPDGSTGLLVSGGSMATLTALTVARHRAAVRVGVDVRADGMQGHGRRFVLYLGAEGHGSARKAAELLGIGSANIRTIASDDRHRMRPDLLRDQIAHDLADGRVPLAVMATAGAVNTGAVDPVDVIADICADLGVWLHVDGSYGGPAVLLLDRYRDSGTALARVDSLALDPHKWLYAPVDVGLVLLRDRHGARETFSLVPPYLRTDDDPTGVAGPTWFSEYGFDQTRPFRALKVWLMLKHLGLDGYRGLIAHDLAVAARLAAGVTAATDLELLAHGLSVVCFRCRPAGWAGDGAALDALNRQVLSAVQLGGRAFLAGTSVDGVFALRACVVNPGSDGADVDALLTEVRTALSLLTEDQPR
ncbi:aminotransferase class V-fold PLP-dependent enzyme [Plantactinospora sp. S1510]|uniref:Aminotransferase class V-fold PLP-dependent enzyme n=1 Tax=Plantactinospora alkalitolerans TaxID=2789879 RepID=A0ABS0GYE8_9ACTN|nr:pyridoxal-dependent decarboxylase [Plantactinospora alkalitolerans]MBF9131224.1 aminotransferase class V-fold PLP-dependent enzyme [Plantactinospora alkalitolerans]